MLLMAQSVNNLAVGLEVQGSRRRVVMNSILHSRFPPEAFHKAKDGLMFV